MKRITVSFKVLLSISFIVVFSQMNAQDLIKTTEGDILKVRLIDVNEERILYKNWDDLEGEDQTLDSEQVDYVRYERAGSESSDDESEYDYDPLVNHAQKYLETEDVFYTGILGGIVIPVDYYNIPLFNYGFYTEFFVAYDLRGYNRLKLDLGYVHVPADKDIVLQEFLNQNAGLSASDVSNVSYSGDRVFYVSAGSTSEIFFDKWSFNINPRLGLIIPREQEISYELNQPSQSATEITETRFGWLNALAVNARYRLSENIVINGNAMYWDGLYQYFNTFQQRFEVTGMRTVNVGVGISYSIPY